MKQSFWDVRDQIGNGIEKEFQEANIWKIQWLKSKEHLPGERANAWTVH
jgi:hypothetical protein